MSLSLAEVESYLETIKIVEDNVDSDIFIDNDKELKHYQLDHSYRLWRSLQIITKHIPINRPIRVLELGSAPYLFSGLLSQYCNYKITGSNVKAGAMPYKSKKIEKVMVKLHHGKEINVKELPVYIFNFELDTFPFEDKTFDLVLCMEVIEHLAYSPNHMLTEAHRVLKPGGTLLLSTPNSLCLNKTILMLRNIPIAFKYSGYGVYGRHNREFSNQELVLLAKSCGYNVQEVLQENVYTHLKPWPPQTFEDVLYKLIYNISNLPISYFIKKRDYIFVVATATGNYKLNYPEYLYHYPNLYNQ